MYYVAHDPILMIAAIVPAIYLMVYIYRHDKLESEPKGLLVKLVIFGILSVIPVMITESIGSSVLASLFYEGTVIFNALMYFIVVALSEEGFKYLFLRWGSWKHPAFNCQFDGVVYAVFVSLGFALFENIMYVAQYGLMTALIRAITAVPGHASFGVMMGAWYGMEKKYAARGDMFKSRKYRKLALLVPVLLHGAYDFIASMGTNFGIILFVILVIAMFGFCRRMVKVLSANDSYINNDPDFTYRDIR